MVTATTRDSRGREVRREFLREHVKDIRTTANGTVLIVAAMVAPTQGAERVLMSFGFWHPFGLVVDDPQ